MSAVSQNVGHLSIVSSILGFLLVFSEMVIND